MSGQTIIKCLDQLVASSDAAVVVLGPESGNDRMARANAIFELGMLAGRLGRDRVLTIVTPDAVFPSDISGSQYLVLDSSRHESLRVELERWSRNLGLTNSGDGFGGL
jgi:predicted nucleotide-binding protein